MKKYLFLLLLLYICIMATAQETPDSTDVFFRHLNLSEVVVTGVAGETKLKNASTPISLITNDELHHTVASNIIDAIARKPGLSQITTGSGISKPVIRGLGYNRLIVVSDGIRQEGQQWGDEHGIEIDGNNVGSVEILKGPASLMYGSDAMAGVLVFNSEPIVPLGEVRGSLSSEYQSNNGLLGYSLRLGGNQKGLAWSLRYSGKHAHAYKNRYDGYVPNSQFSEQALSALLGIHRDWGFSRLRLSYFQTTPSIIEGERDEETGELERPYEKVKTYGHGLPYQKVYHYKAVWDNSIRIGDGRLKAIVGYQQNQRKEFEEEDDPNRYGLYFQLHTLNYDFRYTINENEGWKTAIGTNGMYQRSLNKGDEYLIPAYRLFDIGLYLTTGKEFGRWSVNGGIRFDRRNIHSEALTDDGEERFEQFSRHFNGVTGSIGAVWHLTPMLNLRANIARGFRAPNISELGSNGVHEGTIRYELGNHQLKAEYSWQADMGADFSSKWVSAQVNLFATAIDNYIFLHRIDGVQTEGYNTYKFDSGDARLYGLEAELDFHPFHSLHIGNTFSMVNATQRHQPRESKYLPFTPPARWNAEVKYEITHDGQLLNNAFVAVGMTCNFRQNHFYAAEQTETATPGYTLFNLSAGSDLTVRGKKVASLFMEVSNLTNKAYQHHLSRLKYADVNPVTGRRGVFNMGRNIIVKLQIPIM